jgi:hypothetical protein
VTERDKADKTLLSKYLPKNLECLFKEQLQGPDDYFVPPDWLLEAILEVADSPALPPKKPPVRFATDVESLAFNEQLLAQYDYDLGALLDAHQDTTLGYGSEFRPIDQLAKLFGPHPNFPFFRKVLGTGMEYFVDTELSEPERIAKLDANLERGNHQSASLACASPASRHGEAVCTASRWITHTKSKADTRPIIRHHRGQGFRQLQSRHVTVHRDGVRMVPEPEAYPGASLPFGQARDLAVNIPTRIDALTDSFIDDLIRVFLDTLSNRA